MKSRRFENEWILRIDKGEEIVEELKRFCKENAIRLGAVSGIGATGHATVGLFKTSTKEYLTTEFTGDYEITSLTGNVSSMNGDVYIHLHVTLSDHDYNAFGGHLSAAVVSGTCEINLRQISGEVDRAFDEEVGLNLYKL